MKNISFCHFIYDHIIDCFIKLSLASELHRLIIIEPNEKFLETSNNQVSDLPIIDIHKTNNLGQTFKKRFFLSRIFDFYFFLVQRFYNTFEIYFSHLQRVLSGGSHFLNHLRYHILENFNPMKFFPFRL